LQNQSLFIPHSKPFHSGRSLFIKHDRILPFLKTILIQIF
jgi:hypothetical protein